MHVLSDSVTEEGKLVSCIGDNLKWDVDSAYCIHVLDTVLLRAMVARTLVCRK